MSPRLGSSSINKRISESSPKSNKQKKKNSSKSDDDDYNDRRSSNRRGSNGGNTTRVSNKKKNSRDYEEESDSSDNDNYDRRSTTTRKNKNKKKNRDLQDYDSDDDDYNDERYRNNNNNKTGHHHQRPHLDKENQAYSSSSTALKATLTDILDEYVCPITYELPLDPVTAEDGRIYERDAIEEWIKRSEDNDYKKLKSPYTKKKMGPKLFPSDHVKNVIEKTLRSGALPKDRKIAAKWLQRLEDDRTIKELKSIIRNANYDSDDDDDNKDCEYLESMYKLGRLYHGRDEYEESFMWYKRACDMGHIKSMAVAGKYLTCGFGVKEANVKEGLMILGCAAGMGSDFACYEVGFAHQGGTGSPNKALAKFWLTKAVNGSCKYKHLPKNRFDDAVKALKKLRKLK